LQREDVLRTVVSELNDKNALLVSARLHPIEKSDRAAQTRVVRTRAGGFSLFDDGWVKRDEEVQATAATSVAFTVLFHFLFFLTRGGSLAV
jgi:hypothetical protein